MKSNLLNHFDLDRYQTYKIPINLDEINSSILMSIDLLISNAIYLEIEINISEFYIN